jgi:hypothetical protein
MSDSAYEERYCAFADILGFSELVKTLEHRPAGRFVMIRDLLKAVHSPADITLKRAKNADFRAQSISDAVALSTQATNEGLTVLCAALINLGMKLLHDGYFIRGAICRGPLYHDDSMVFGEALLKAYAFESEVARFPRIVMTSDIVKAVRGSLGKDNPSFIRQAEDGPFYLHMLRRLELTVDAIRTHSKDASSARVNLSYYAETAHQIQRRFDESFDAPRHFEKVQWFARYWNRTIGVEGYVERIHGAGL